MRRPGAKEKICERCAQQTVYDQLKPGVEDAQDYVVSDPDERQPARPIAAAEHVHATHNGDETEKFDPHDIVLKRMLRLEPGEVVSKADHTGYYVHASDDGHGEGALIHVEKRFSGLPITAEWIDDGPGAAYSSLTKMLRN